MDASWDALIAAGYTDMKNRDVPAVLTLSLNIGISETIKATATLV